MKSSDDKNRIRSVYLFVITAVIYLQFKFCFLFCDSYQISVRSLAELVYYLPSRSPLNIRRWVTFITRLNVSEVLFEIPE